jgi:diguanylate cyclase (GGDEF)-like protein
VAIHDADGTLLAGAATRPDMTLPPPFVERALRSVRPTWEREGDHLRISVPVETGTRWATLSAQYSLDRMNADVARTRTRWFVLAAVLSAVLGLGLFIGLDRLVVRPLRRLEKVARKMGAGDLDARAPEVVGSEVSQLGTTLNQMAASLQAERQNLERAVADRTRELSEANERLEKLAVTDGLTGVFNHRRFHEALVRDVQRAERSQQPLSVLMIDVDFFKQFNDTHGHPAGDRLLRDLAKSVAPLLRQTDLLARYGGEEFAAILVDTGKEEAIQVGERLRRAVERELGRDTSPVTISVGVASLREDANGPEALLRRADEALYAAKHAGRNRVVAASLPGGGTVTPIDAARGDNHGG